MNRFLALGYLITLMIASIAPAAASGNQASLQAASPDTLSASQQIARQVFKDLIEINTTDSVGSTTEAAEAMAARLIAAGLPKADVQVLGPHPQVRELNAEKPDAAIDVQQVSRSALSQAVAHDLH